MLDEQHVLALPAGYQLGKYHFKGVLGSGGFGITYLAEDITLNRKVAIKEMLPGDFATRIDGTTVVAKTQSEKANLAWARARFVDEGRALAACEHPNVVNVYEMIEANGTAYMVTKYEEGRSLERWLRDLGRAPKESELRGILMPLLSGLDCVHRTGFLHRDIKPANIYLTTDGRPVLLDFGSARQAISSRSMMMTSIISAGYAPFEQYHEDGNQGAWSDIYALGAVMYRAITGNKPPESVRRLQNDPCQKLATSYTGQYDARFLTAIDCALNVNESQRPQSVAEWRDMLGSGAECVLAPAPEAVSVPIGKRRVKNFAGAREFVKAFPKQIAAGAVALVAIAAGTWFFTRPKPTLLVDGKTRQAAEVAKKTTADQTGEKQQQPPNQLSPNEQQSSPAESPPKEQESSPGREARSDQPPSPSSVVVEQPSVWAEESPQERQVAVQPPPGRVEPESTPSHQTPKPQPESSPVVSTSPTAGQTGEAIAVDPKLVGTWDGRPNGSKGAWDRRWEVQADGSYTISGAVTESGNLTASNGKIEKELDSTLQPTEVLYKFGGNTLYTTDADGSTTVWRLMGGGSSKEKTAGSRTSGSPARHSRRSATPSNPSPGIIHEIKRYLHLPF